MTGDAKIFWQKNAKYMPALRNRTGPKRHELKKQLYFCKADDTLEEIKLIEICCARAVMHPNFVIIFGRQALGMKGSRLQRLMEKIRY